MIVTFDSPQIMYSIKVSLLEMILIIHFIFFQSFNCCVSLWVWPVILPPSHFLQGEELHQGSCVTPVDRSMGCPLHLTCSKPFQFLRMNYFWNSGWLEYVILMTKCSFLSNVCSCKQTWMYGIYWKLICILDK